MIFSRRLPGVFFKYKYTILSFLLFISAFVYFLIRWNIICTNVQTWQHVAKILKMLPCPELGKLKTAPPHPSLKHHTHPIKKSSLANQDFGLKLPLKLYKPTDDSVELVATLIACSVFQEIEGMQSSTQNDTQFEILPSPEIGKLKTAHPHQSLKHHTHPIKKSSLANQDFGLKLPLKLYKPTDDSVELVATLIACNVFQEIEGKQSSTQNDTQFKILPCPEIGKLKTAHPHQSLKHHTHPIKKSTLANQDFGLKLPLKLYKPTDDSVELVATLIACSVFQEIEGMQSSTQNDTQFEILPSPEIGKLKTAHPHQSLKHHTHPIKKSSLANQDFGLKLPLKLYKPTDDSVELVATLIACNVFQEIEGMQSSTQKDTQFKILPCPEIGKLKTAHPHQSLKHHTHPIKKSTLANQDFDLKLPLKFYKPTDDSVELVATLIACSVFQEIEEMESSTQHDTQFKILPCPEIGKLKTAHPHQSLKHHTHPIKKSSLANQDFGLKLPLKLYKPTDDSVELVAKLIACNVFQEIEGMQSSTQNDTQFKILPCPEIGKLKTAHPHQSLKHHTHPIKKSTLANQDFGLKLPLKLYKPTDDSVELVAKLIACNVFQEIEGMQSSTQNDTQCKLYEEKKAVGSLCVPLCVTNEIQSLTCHSFKGTKDAVFSAEWHGTRLVFKSASTDVPPIHWYDNGDIKYPTDKEFRAIISTLVKKKLNFSIPHDTAIYISRLKPTIEEKDRDKRQLEMDNVWVLIQDNEYLLSYLFAEQDIFPQLLGTCGPYFAVEYVGPISDSSSLLSTTDSKEEWGYKLKISTLIMAFLDDLENSFRDQMHLCDIKLEHFGIVHDKSKLKFLDLVHVFPKSTVNKIINHVTKSCENDNECDFYDCRSKCDKDVNKCKGVLNTNLQMVCEKLFLGWRMSNTLIVPGLLISQHTPSQLASILRQCANPEIQELIGRVAPSEEVKNSLRNVLSEVEKSVNEDTEEI